MTDVEAWRQQRRWSDLMDLMEVDPWSDLMWPRVNPSLPLLLSSCHVFSVPHATLSSLLLHHDAVTQLKVKPRSSSPNLNLTHFLIYRASAQKYDTIVLSLECQAIIPYLAMLSWILLYLRRGARSLACLNYWGLNSPFALSSGEVVRVNSSPVSTADNDRLTDCLRYL